MDTMNSFLQVFGEVPIGKVSLYIGALLFMIAVYKVIEKYFKEKALREHLQAKKIQDVIDQSKNYPTWHQQSIKIQDTFNQKIQNLESKMDDLLHSSCEGMAYTWRYRILRFDDEIRHEKKHTKEHFDQILEDITSYEKYCREHPDYPNNKAVLAIRNIKNVYQQCTDEGTFL